MKRAKSFLKREEIKRDNPVLMGRGLKKVIFSSMGRR